MLTRLAPEVLATDAGRRAEQILRSCVHCGFCNATCPTYNLLGDELDGPRGRIYLIKGMLEDNAPSVAARVHLDRCLTCRACETTCPSGVAYGELAEIGRDFIEKPPRATVPRRGIVERVQRAFIKRVVSNPASLRRWATLGSSMKGLLPARLAAAIPLPRPPEPPPERELARRVVLLQGCVQRVATPAPNAALARLLERLGVGVTTLRGEVCCGALPLHLGDSERARALIAANVDVLAQAAEGAEAIISTASGCGVTVKDYGRLLANDPLYAGRAKQIAERTRDAGEFLAAFDFVPVAKAGIRRVAWHPPCTLHHGQRRGAEVEALLVKAGYDLVPVRERNVCCGSAGTYSVLQSELASKLKQHKMAALLEHAPDVIATANVGCELHLAKGSKVPVKHWLELID